MLAVLAVVALHALFLYAIQRMRAHSLDGVHTDAALVMVRIQRPRAPDTEPQRARERNTRSSQRSQQHQSEPTGEPEPTTPATRSRPRRIDWRANAARSAQVLVESSLEEQYRSFGPRAEPGRAARLPESVFGPGPKHQHGEIGEDAYGDPALWLNDSCYQELEKPVPTARDVFTIVPLVKCLIPIGKPEANGKLFEHIKKRAEPPVPKVGTEMNPLPVREETSEED